MRTISCNESSLASGASGVNSITLPSSLEQLVVHRKLANCCRFRLATGGVASVAVVTLSNHVQKKWLLEYFMYNISMSFIN